MVHIKICGVTRPEHAEAAIDAGAAFVGLLFAEQSKRRVTVEQAKRIVCAVRGDAPSVSPLALTGDGPWFHKCATALNEQLEEGGPLIVGVFANQPVALVNAIAESVGLDLIQLSGTERWDTCLQLHRPVIKTVRTEPGVPTAAMRQSLEPGMAHLLHVDAFVQGEMGGTGVTAAWDVATALACDLPIMLAGGLTPENVEDAIMRVRPWAVDVSSGVESGGVKDVTLIRAFTKAARAAAMVDDDHG